MTLNFHSLIWLAECQKKSKYGFEFDLNFLKITLYQVFIVPIISPSVLEETKK